jgi:hypothetical protein
MKYLHIVSNSKGEQWQERILNSETPVGTFKSQANRLNASYKIYQLDNSLNYNKKINLEAATIVVVKENN